MKFTAEGKDLKSAIALCERAADRKSTMPILANVKLDVGNNCHATLTATDLGVWAMARGTERWQRLAPVAHGCANCGRAVDVPSDACGACRQTADNRRHARCLATHRPHDTGHGYMWCVAPECVAARHYVASDWVPTYDESEQDYGIVEVF
jgi:hypothetical protein